jgi:hypothetical protein
MGSRLAIPGLRAPAAWAAVMALFGTGQLSAQTLASFETELPDLGNVEGSTDVLEASSTALLTPDLSATWQSRSGWRVGGSFFNPIESNASGFDQGHAALSDASFSFDFENSSFLTAGLGYRDADGWRFGAEIHFIEMVDTGGLDRDGFTTDINALDIQWRSAPVVAVGGVVPLGDNLRLRSGVTWNRNQVRPLDHAFNAMAPGLLQSSFNVGLEWQWSEEVQWFLNYRSGTADYLPSNLSGALGAFGVDHADGTLGVVSFTIGLELAL